MATTACSFPERPPLAYLKHKMRNLSGSYASIFLQGLVQSVSMWMGGNFQ
ncbi:hypothetical protein GCM10023228_33300 [Brevibacillus fulvus]